ncbi:MAG TPA: hypothetical protein VJI15_06450 [Candidatus Nanoarchaeia archaeon]|nr:hypothetical protein [Candidatus Nanoarchaeia archaeon]
MRWYIPPLPERDGGNVSGRDNYNSGFVLIYDSQRAADEGITLNQLIQRQVPRALLDTQGHPISRRKGRVYDFEQRRVRPIEEKVDYDGNSTHWIQFQNKEDVIAFVDKNYRSGRRLTLPPSIS